jgi:exopolyphosphatase/guanosine-5'-triphosphate,3'-diphosphate pyrophosphatase
MPQDMANDRTPSDAATFASIDIGSHTGRLLIAERIEGLDLFHPILRERAYIRLAEDFEDGRIGPEAMDRTVRTLEDFVSTARRHHVDTIRAVATGVVREASNKERFLAAIQDKTGIQVRLLSGVEEARLTGKGVSRSLNMGRRPFVIFDLGGGSTEFLFGLDSKAEVRSIPLGAMVLTRKYLKGDPPEEKDLMRLEKHIAETLGNALAATLARGEDQIVVGTGGTVTTLAAMIQGIETDDIGPDNIHGVFLKLEELGTLFRIISTRSFEERLKLSGLDRGRADVIVAGAMVVGGILEFLKSPGVVVSFSDILEGVLVDWLTESKA